MGASEGMPILSLRTLNTVTVTLALGLVALAGWHVQNPGHFEQMAAAAPVQQTTELSFLQTSNFVDQIYLYAGLAVDNKHETGFIAKEIRKHNYQTMVRLFTSLDDATFRAVLWDQSVHCLVWPPFVRYPGISETAKTDLRAYAAAGNNVVLLGNYVAVQFMNDVFGFQLTDDYQNGPYYRNDRNVRNTPYQYLPSRVEQASIETYAVKTRSLPPGGKSMLDTLGATVAFVIRYDLGTVCYIGYNYNTPFHADQWTRVLHCAIDM